MRNKRINATRSTTEIRLYAVDTAEHGRESVTVILPPTLSVKNVRSKEN
ncbi:hypothetical protein HNQ56_000816 [Anaerotaenia torta]